MRSDWLGNYRQLETNSSRACPPHSRPPPMSAAALLRARPALPAARSIARARWVSNSAPAAYATHTDSNAESAGDRVPASSKPLLKEFKIYRWVNTLFRPE